MEVGDYLLLLLVFFGGESVVLDWTYRRARSKGYRPPAAAPILLFWWFFWVPMLLSAAALVWRVLILPRRTVRVFGEPKARFPFSWIGPPAPTCWRSQSWC